MAQTAGWCTTMDNIQRRAQNNVQLQQQIEDMKTYLLQQADNTPRGSDATQDVIYIPVVFHIVSNGDAVGSGENITDAQVISQITAMNLHYTAQDQNIGNTPSVFVSRIGNVNVQFCLAKFDPDGNPTNGIVRHTLSNASWDTDTDIDNILKPATIWDHTKYLNIWSVRMGGDLATQGVLGYSSLPFFGQADQDGIAVRYNTVGTTGTLIAGHNLGKTITHEAGHWLGLLHIWGLDANCGDAGDYVADTPDQADLNFGCPSFPHITCNNGPDGDMYMNYMDYTDDACSYMFSAGQASNIHTAIDNYRAGIKTASSECFLNLDAAVVKIDFPKDTICSFNFRPVVTLKNEGTTTISSGKFYYQIDGDVVQIYNWSGALASQSSIQVTLPLQQVFVQDFHTLDVTFGNVNGQAVDNFSGNDSKQVNFFALNGSAGSATPFAEGFESAIPAAWEVYNPNSDAVKWDRTPSYGGYNTSTSAVWIDNSAYASNPNKKKDAVITESFDLSAISSAELKFDVAYAQYSAARTDSLNVYYSLDCGSNWIKVWNQKGSQLATAPDQTTQFLPTAGQWKTVSVPLAFLAGQNKVSFKFENVSGWGNALYLDNINLQNNPSLSVEALSAKVAIQVFPNPASSLVGVRLPANHGFNQLQILNSVGALVNEIPVTENAMVLPVADFANGLYLLHFTGPKASQTERLLISK